MSSIFAVQSWRLGDIVAGVTVAATSLPQYIAYAELAGLSAHKGLVASGPPIVAYALLTKSPILCIGVTSISALMAKANLNGEDYKEAYGDERWSDLLGAYAVLVGVASLVLSLLGATKLTKYIPGSVMAGWKLGFAITVVAAQTSGAVFKNGSSVRKLVALPTLFGAPVTGGTAAMYRLGWMLVHPYKWDAQAVGLTVVTLLILLRCKDMLQRIFRLAGVEVIIACVFCTMISIAGGYSGDVVGAVPNSGSAGLMQLATGWQQRWPWEMDYGEVADRLGGWIPTIVSVVLYAIVDFLAIVSVVPAAPVGELAGQGVSCVISGMAGSAPIGGSLSRSLVARMTGASSPLMGFTAGLATVALALPKVGAALAPAPKAVLAAVVLAAVLPSVVNPKDVRKLSSTAAATAWVTAVASCCTDPTKGFVMGLLFHASTLALGLGQSTPEETESDNKAAPQASPASTSRVVPRAGCLSGLKSSVCGGSKPS
jgi:MFS superfamily sulfate permease-like transporter